MLCWFFCVANWPWKETDAFINYSCVRWVIRVFGLDDLKSVFATGTSDRQPLSNELKTWSFNSFALGLHLVELDRLNSTHQHKKLMRARIVKGVKIFSMHINFGAIFHKDADGKKMSVNYKPRTQNKNWLRPRLRQLANKLLSLKMWALAVRSTHAVQLTNPLIGHRSFSNQILHWMMVNMVIGIINLSTPALNRSDYHNYPVIYICNWPQTVAYQTNWFLVWNFNGDLINFRR